MPFSDQLKRLREDKGLTHEELAKKLDIDRTSIVHYENPKNGRIPRPDRMEKIADFFDVSIDYLLDRAGENELTEDEAEFVSDTEQLSVEELQKEYQLTIDGEPATKDELEGAIAFIRSLRELK